MILATDADVDGLHIRNLLITFFLRFFPDLITHGHLFILETPLFRVRNKKKTVYCYDEAERESAPCRRLPTPEITRFKGLGEISPGEFKAFVGAEMRLSPGGGRKPACDPAHPRFLHGQEHPRNAAPTSWIGWWLRPKKRLPFEAARGACGVSRGTQTGVAPGGQTRYNLCSV